MKIRSKDNIVFDVKADFIEWVVYRFTEKGFEVKNKYAFVRGFLSKWYGKTIQRWIDEWEKEKEKFMGGIFDIKLPF
ncbi:MAG: hypothetical protein NC925_03605 [Candidatus Omnitrophica bacterium]|nr:hypothetical protein [Candidatus Omnitrophota bacterium]